LKDIFDRVASDIDSSANRIYDTHPFFMFEPWDVKKRADWIIKQAQEDGIDLYAPEYIRHIKQDPHTFQSGYMESQKFLRVLLAGSQVGKSYPAFMELVIMASGQLPYSLRYERGYDTGIKRAVTKENILRFGRLDTRTGELIDNNWRKKPDPQEWDCGTVKGAGVYPQEKIAPEGSQLWIGTYQRAFNNFWWPRLAANKLLIPPQFIDKSKGNRGYQKQENTVNMVRGIKLVCITYESGYQRFEAEKAWNVVLDEEATDKRIFDAAQQHAQWFSLVFTPYNGITYSKDIIFPDSMTSSSQVFHATQYDSPYQDPAEIEKRLETMEKWVRGARVWGLPTEQTGMPYFDRVKVMGWMSKFSPTYELSKFSPAEAYDGMLTNFSLHKLPGLMNVNIRRNIVEEDNKQNVWKVFEERKPNVPYVFSADPAEGAETPEAVGDMSAGGIMRPPMGEEEKPQIVATTRSTLEVIPFARSCSYAIRYYNNCLVAPEAKRGSANAAFAGELKDYPFWYKHTSVQDSTGRARQQNGFDTNSATRDIIFELIGDWLNDFSENDYPCIPDYELLKELAGAIVAVGRGGKKRCDHTNDGTLDSAIWFGILLYVFKYAPEQIRCNLRTPIKESRRRNETPLLRAPCNMSAMGYRKVRNQ